MKRFFSISILFVFFISASFAQRNYMQEFIDLLQQGRCFEARELRIQHADKLPPNDKTLDLVYKSNMALFFNKPDSAAIYLEDLLANHELILGPVVGPYYGKLLNVYENQQQFTKGVELCDKIIEYFKRNPFDLDKDLVQNEINFMEKIKISFKNRMNEPQIKIERKKQYKDKAIKLHDGEYIRFEAKYNDIPMQTFFDTGVTYHFCMTKALADEIGVKVTDKSQDSIKTINGLPIKALMGIIDSITIKNIKLYNIPVLVFKEKLTSHLPDTLNNDAKSKIESAFSDKQITMGLPAMKLIGGFEFDLKKRTLSFSENTKNIEINNSSNIYLMDNNLYLHLKINGLGYTGYLDTGSDDFLNLAFSFYEKNKSYIKIDSITEKRPLNRYTATGNTTNIPHELVKDAQVYLNGKQINQDGTTIIISDRVSHINTFDGIVGVNFFKKLGSKVIFDFDNMRIEGKN